FGISARKFGKRNAASIVSGDSAETLNRDQCETRYQNEGKLFHCIVPSWKFGRPQYSGPRLVELRWLNRSRCNAEVLGLTPYSPARLLNSNKTGVPRRKPRARRFRESGASRWALAGTLSPSIRELVDSRAGRTQAHLA